MLGFEKSEKKTALVNAGKNYIKDIDDTVMQSCVKNGHLSATLDTSRIRECDSVMICVPTPLDRFKKPT